MRNDSFRHEFVCRRPILLEQPCLPAQALSGMVTVTDTTERGTV